MKFLVAYLMFLAVALGATAPAFAQSSQSIQIRQLQGGAAGKWYTVDSRFMSGMELNRAIGTAEYDLLKKYAIVFWAKDQASLIETTGTLACLPALGTCTSIGKVTGVDQDGQEWEICTGNICY